MPHNFQNSAANADRIVDDTNSNNSKRFAAKTNAETGHKYNWPKGRGRGSIGNNNNTIKDGEAFFHPKRSCQGLDCGQTFPGTEHVKTELLNNSSGSTTGNFLYRQNPRLGIITNYDDDKAPQSTSHWDDDDDTDPKDVGTNDDNDVYKCESVKDCPNAAICNWNTDEDCLGDVNNDNDIKDDRGESDVKDKIYVDEEEEERENHDAQKGRVSPHAEDDADDKNSSNGDTDNAAVINDNEEDVSEDPSSQTTETETELEAPKVSKSKSYWRKQRRLRLKELLVAQRQKMEADGMSPEEILQERLEMNKKKKSLKPKVEIDYDKYLPANILMHVKRDLVSILMEYGQTREVKVSFEEMDRTGPHHASRFFTSAVVHGETFPVGCGSSKKNAKKAAAAFALKIMYERGKQNLRMVNESAFRKIGALNPKDPESRAHKVLLASRYALEVCQETQFINYSKEKIVATFVLELHGKMKVVALGTGNRCILYPNLTKDGKKVIHAHAEIIARRAFIRYLYKQLLTYTRGRSHPIFNKSESGKLKLRDKIQVHLYISRPPCGDAAAFPTIGNHPNKMRAVRKQGQLRTIIDDGEGAIPTEFIVPAGPNGKERLRIMTCSDKICRWNALGIQGALLTHFIDPIYINTLVIGSHTGDQRGHLPRAISGRIKCGRLHEVIQRPYRINSPEIQYPHDDMCDIYAINKSKQYFITWSYGDDDTEVIDAITGVTNMEPMDDPKISRVCKRSLHTLFMELCDKFGRTDLIHMDYCTAKRCATTFQRMKSFVGQHMAVMGFGHWYSLQETYGTDNFTTNIDDEEDDEDDCPTWC